MNTITWENSFNETDITSTSYTVIEPDSGSEVVIHQPTFKQSENSGWLLSEGILNEGSQPNQRISLQASESVSYILYQTLKANFDVSHELDEFLMVEKPLTHSKRKANPDLEKMKPELRQLEEQ